MSQRFKDAFEVQKLGACNPCGIASTLVAACRECLAEGVSQCEDPAVQLIVHQLAFLCGTLNVDRHYNELMDQCEQRARS